ncbi:MAG: hypothetical protein ACK5MD_08060 [Flavobacteriales bacterium]
MNKNCTNKEFLLEKEIELKAKGYKIGKSAINNYIKELKSKSANIIEIN